MGNAVSYPYPLGKAFFPIILAIAPPAPRLAPPEPVRPSPDLGSRPRNPAASPTTTARRSPAGLRAAAPLPADGLRASRAVAVLGSEPPAPGRRLVSLPMAPPSTSSRMRSVTHITISRSCSAVMLSTRKVIVKLHLLIL
ncbi:hypothetical protein SORBI_3006G043901 [Sorghum bicolor]|uniref:Uncharacterized protein n=1 Tax=Sorghum bicolor TaxID=4558 RepID=A0A1Z5RD09_SORBI|nr:hypothetical protein SORBI_3006G043901 [Sorghum bicolor]